MTLAPLATLDDLSVRMARAIDPADAARAERLIADASAAVRDYTGQQFTHGETTDRLKINGRTVTLPQRPVVAVASVVDVNASPVQFTWDGAERLIVATNVPDRWAWEPWRNGINVVDVTYTHGYEEIPDTVIAVVCQMAGRAFGRPAENSGVTTESIEGYSYTIGAVAAAGAVGMLAEERATLDRYRRQVSVTRTL